MYQLFFDKVKLASRQLTSVSDEVLQAVLLDLSAALLAAKEMIISANHKDLMRMDRSDPRYDRLLLSPERIDDIARGVKEVANLPGPLGEVLEQRILPNGLQLTKKRVPLGVVGVIYEARPNVTIDVFALCWRSGNACVLKGGSDAADSNAALVSILHKVLQRHGLSPDVVQLLPNDRAATQALMRAVDQVDVLIPRGSQGLINAVRDQAKVPVIETGAGIVHAYFDQSGDVKLGQKVLLNAKTRRVSVCNALDCLIIHRSRLSDLSALLAPMATAGVAVYADEAAHYQLKGNYPDAILFEAGENDFGTEFLAMKLAVKTVSGLHEALDHIARYSSKHSEAIIAEDKEVIERYLNGVDAAALYVNASTAFTDGAQFGLGAEIGISTQKLHARGPMGLRELTTYKWIVKGQGQVRPA
ncbi:MULTISPECIES: glutamate-5-semialdehyde dehydrogenase [unclassified Carboxylicivirga]|uniref:glutamate-5-semialdehyde dehydrogenase n=1 Tax=Carboxylicivirga TaxID=1628153 RepID=UPI003D3477DC